MKNALTIITLSLALAACGGSSDRESERNEDTAAVNNTATEVTTDTAAKLTVAAPDSLAAEKPKDAIPTAKPVGSPAEKKEAAKEIPQPPGSVKGGELIKASDCLACHREDQKLVGPAYKDVAHKYKPTAANIDMLASKVINGGSGNWGDVPMSPHPAVSKKDAKEMVKYILAIK